MNGRYIEVDIFGYFLSVWFFIYTGDVITKVENKIIDDRKGADIIESLAKNTSYELTRNTTGIKFNKFIPL